MINKIKNFFSGNVNSVTVKKEIGAGGYMGYCHKYWHYKKKYLKELFNIDWKSPAELNPDTKFD